MTGTQPRVWLRASANGNGVGLVGACVGSTELWIHVLPKVWRGREPRVLTLRGLPSGERHAVVYEGDYLEVPAAFADVVRLAERDLSGEPQRADERSGAGADTPPLWSRAIAPARAEALHTTVAAEPHVASMWRLIEQHAGALSDRVRDLDETFLGSPTVMHWDWLRPHLLRRFVREVAEALAYRRPAYVEVAEELMAVRGRLPVAQLVSRRVHRRLLVSCEYDSLEEDLLVWQTVRRAIMTCAQELQGAVGEEALLCDAALADVSIAPIAELLARESQVRGAVRQAQLQRVYGLAVSILRVDSRVHSPDPMQSGVGVELKVVTSDLWEALLADALRRGGLEVHARGTAVKTRLFARGPRPKDIDLVVGPEAAPWLLIDGKYKGAPKHLGRAAMEDQYQLYGYINTKHASGLLAYPVPPGATDGLDARLSVPEWEDLWVEAVETAREQGGPNLRAGVVALPFPRVGETVLSEESVDALRSLAADASHHANTYPTTP